MHAACHWSGPAGHEVSTDPTRLDLERVHRFLSGSCWSTAIPRAVMERAIANSIPFGLYAPAGQQVGFARAISDCATFAYVADVYVEIEHRGCGLRKFLIACVLEHPDLQGLRRWALATADAHGLYQQHGFGPAAEPGRYMFIEQPVSELWPGEAEDA